MLICLDQRTAQGCETRNRDGSEVCTHCGRPLRFALHIRNPRTTVAGYRIVGVIGYGAFGAVYEAERAPTDGMRVALKEIFDASGIGSLEHEFAVLNSLHHPNLPRYYEMFEAEQSGFLAMELVPGQSLADVLAKQGGPLVEAQVLGYALQLCDVLDYLHTQPQPVLHRDIKPANIRLTPEGLIKLVDFGLLKQQGQQTRQTIRGLGTPAYAPIEQYGTGELSTDPRSDIYSLGATLYQLLTGQEPPLAPQRVVAGQDPLLSPQRAISGISRPVAASVMMALALRPEARPASAAELKQMLMGKEPAIQAERPRSTTSAPLDDLVSLPGREKIVLQIIRSGEGERLVRGNREVTSLAWHPQGHLLASGSMDGFLRLWNPERGELQHEWQTHRGNVASIAWHPDGQRLATTGWDGRTRVWEVDPPSFLYALTDGRPNPNDVGQRALFSPGNPAVPLIDQPLRYPLGVTVSQELCAPHTLTGLYDLLRLWPRHQPWGSSLAWSPDGKFLAGGSFGRTILLWDGADGTLIRVLEGHTGPVTGLVWHPKGQLLASSARDKTLRIWQPAEGRLRHRITTDALTGLLCVSWNASGSTLASGELVKIRLWSASDGGPKHQLSEHTGNVYQIAYSPSGDVLASASHDGSVRLWYPPDGRLLRTFKDTPPPNMPAIPFWSVAWSPDSTHLAAGTNNGTIRLWRVL